MNPIVIDGQRKRISGPTPSRRSQTAGARARLIGSLQERFGYSRKRATRELWRRMGKHRARDAARAAGRP